MPDHDLTVPELAALLGMSEKWVKRQVSARAIPHHRRGRAVRFTPADVAAIREQGAEPVIPAPAPGVGLRLVTNRPASDTPAPGTPPPSPPPPQPPRPPGPGRAHLQERAA